MEGRSPKTILVVFTNCSDPAKEEEFNRWYNEIHIPDILSAGGFSTATRWVNSNPKPGEHKFLAIYESDKESQKVEALLSQITGKLQEQGRIHPNLADVKSMFFSHLSTALPAAATATQEGARQ